MITVLNILGIGDDNSVKIINNIGDITKFTFQIDGNSNIVTNNTVPDVSIVTIVFGGHNQNIQLNIGKDVVLFNSICNPDSSTKALKLLSDFVKKTPLPIINHPDDVLQTTRDGIANKLSNIDGVIMPRCIKVSPNSIQEVKEIIEKESFPLPLIFRTACEHGSENMIKIDSLDDLSVLECFALNGDIDYYMIEFVDYKSNDGNYRKMRYWIMGDKVIPRHLVVSSTWNISYDIKKEMMSNNQKWQKEEKIFVKENNIINTKKCLAIKKALNLDYFGIDCNIDENGNMLIFEATPCMALVEDKNFPYINKAVTTTNKATKELIMEKLSR